MASHAKKTSAIREAKLDKMKKASRKRKQRKLAQLKKSGVIDIN